MLRDARAWQRWQDAQTASEPADPRRNLEMLDAMYEHAAALGVLSSADPWEGVEARVRLARLLHCSVKPSKP